MKRECIDADLCSACLFVSLFGGVSVLFCCRKGSVLIPYVVLELLIKSNLDAIKSK